jgi:hypothetical protein
MVDGWMDRNEMGSRRKGRKEAQWKEEGAKAQRYAPSRIVTHALDPLRITIVPEGFEKPSEAS